MNLMVPQGWQCPICSRVYSPTTPMCFSCPSTTVSQATTGTSQFAAGRQTIPREDLEKLFRAHAFNNDLKYSDDLYAYTAGIIEKLFNPSKKEKP